MLLDGRVALVTGAGSGIGRATALLLAKEGARIGALGLSRPRLDEVVREIADRGGKATALTANVVDAGAMQKAVEQLVDEHGRLDIAVANAGINGVAAPIDDLTPEEWDQTLSVNLKGSFLTLRYSVPYLKRQGGSIILVASINGTRIFSNPGTHAYSASKAGQVSLTKTAALELAPHRVRVNVVCPGWIETNIERNTVKRNTEQAKWQANFPRGIVPLTGGKPASADKVAQAILFLASDMADHISGTELWVDGAESLIGEAED